MKTIRVSFLIVLFALPALAAAVEPRLPDTVRIDKLLWEIPDYQPYIVPGTDMEASDDQILARAAEIFSVQENIAYGSFINEDSSITYVEEYCLAAFMTGRKLPYPKLQKAFEEEFPYNVEGYHRMASLWFRVHAENPAYNERALEAVPLVVKQAGKKGITITEKSVREYYEKAVKNSLGAAFQSEFTKAGLKPDAVSLEKLVRPWCLYFLDPSTDNFAVITAARNCVEDISKSRKGMGALPKAYDDAIRRFAGEPFFIHWSYSTSRSGFYEEDIEKVAAEYFSGIPLFGK